ncbi:MAG: [FeFe] hydrogenase H-cluster radical SAM maturase HydE [Clostridia bacterium]|nr:[FeFe] hydrogenase H-cluster radical SAM maturase HydE [Clostridia bacterium]
MYNFSTALAGIRAGEKLSREMVMALLAAEGRQVSALFKAADEVRRATVGDAVHLRAIIEFSNYCRQNCLYCGLRRDNCSLPRYRLTEAQILAAVAEAAELGFRTVVLQSGEDLYYSSLEIARLIEKIKSRHDLAITLSLGERCREDYRLWRQAGADRYLLKHETADADLFHYLKPDSRLSSRLQCASWLKELGYQTGMGNMVGLPGQNLETLATDVLLMRQMEVGMAGIGPFLPHPSTPLKDAAPGDLELSLRTLAVTRLALPYAHLPATTALRSLSPEGLRLALSCGANVIMLNLTPQSVRNKYLIYPQKADMIEKPEAALEKVKKLLAELGRPLARGYGHAVKTGGGNSGANHES